jgi:hypothetical protein
LNPTRVTVAFDQTTANVLESLSKESGLSQSEIMRRALRVYNENKALYDPLTAKRMHAYADMLLDGEHVILDVDHWLLFLRLIENSPLKEEFWKEHREIARAHWNQLTPKITTPEELLFRLETCNLFRLKKNSDNDFTLILVSELSKDFVKFFLDEYFASMGISVQVTENLTKLRVLIQPTPRNKR